MFSGTGRIFRALALALFLLPFPASAQGTVNTPEAAVRNFVAALQTLDYDRAARFVLGADVGSPFWQEFRKQTKEDLDYLVKPVLEGCQVTIQGDKAEVILTLRESKDSSATSVERLRLTSRDGSWVLLPPEWEGGPPAGTGPMGAMAFLMTPRGVMAVQRGQAERAQAVATKNNAMTFTRELRRVLDQLQDSPSPKWNDSPEGNFARAQEAVRRVLADTRVAALKNPVHPDRKAFVQGPAQDELGTVYVDLGNARRKGAAYIVVVSVFPNGRGAMDLVTENVRLR